MTYTVHPHLPDLTYDDQTIRVRPICAHLLRYLIQERGRCLSATHLADLLALHHPTPVSTTYVNQLVCLLRQITAKYGWPDPIETVPKKGYRLVVQK